MSSQRPRKSEIATVSLEAEILTAAVRYTDQALAATNQLLAQWGMTAVQHSALRVIYLCDEDGQGLPSSEIGKRLVTRLPDVTRLLDRLAERGWVIRERDSNNRRIVRSRLTAIGVELVESVHTSLRNHELTSLAHMTQSDREALKQLLERAAAP